MTSSPRQVELAFDPAAIDRKWQARWEEDSLYKVLDDDHRPKWYEMTMYPYPSGDLHIGHWYAMAPADAHADALAVADIVLEASGGKGALREMSDTLLARQLIA